ncbi:MAG: pyruvate, phosphate dikinase [Actinobacteria bacterium]|nr:pyruvate, phosphate dikinase [Actinomycetota bacterium]
MPGPLVLALDDPGAGLAVAGGKGAALARLTRAGFPVPPGFVVTTGAYLDFMGRDGLREQVLAAVAGVDDADLATFAAAAARIGELVAAQPMPTSTATAIAGGYALLGDQVPVAVRSSATAEDRPGLSAAGQHDTYLNVRGEAAVLDAVKRCWASLWSARAIGYRARRGVDPDALSIGVVIQRLVPADAAGVLLTAGAAAGAPGQLVISANWGLGESVVAGEVTPDVAYVDQATLRLTRYQLGSKQTMTVADGAGTRTTGIPDALRTAAVLTPGQTTELARAGLAVEKLYGQPMDVEWARADGQLWVLQARPIITPEPADAAEQWNDSLDGDYLWTNGNVGEALPDVMTPATWSFVELFMTRMVFPPSLPGYRGYGRIGGRFYVNVSMAVALEARTGIPARRFTTLFGPVLGPLPPLAEIPRPRLPRWRVTRLMVPAAFTLLGRLLASYRRMPGFLAAAPERCDRLRAEIERTADPAELARLWMAEVRPLIEEAAGTLAGATSRGFTLLSAPRRLARLTGPADAALLLSGQEPGQSPLASLGPVIGLARLARGEISRDTFARQYGHRGPHELELSVPRPAENPRWIDGQVADRPGAVAGAETMLARQQAARAAAWQRLGRQHPREATAARKVIARWAPVARDREAARSEVVRSAWVARAWVLRAGQLTGRGDDVFFLTLPEVAAVLGGDRDPLARVPARRAAYETYRALPPYPALIRGRFDPVRWAADPDRRTGYWDGRAPAARPDATVTGLPGAAGVVDGTARVLATPEDADQLGDGDILVTTVTNIGWTLLFPRVAAVVTDVGAPLSHAAIVARELGIPAVVGCGDATARLHSGDHIRVDGGRGTVELLRRGPHAQPRV